MQKIVFHKPFMGVQPCEIEFDRFLLLIGEQASGKSTIAKLIYFFQNILMQDAARFCVKKENKKLDEIAFNSKFLSSIAHVFQETFGFGLKNIDISFYYNTENTNEQVINLHHNEEHRLDAVCSFTDDIFQKKGGTTNQFLPKSISSLFPDSDLYSFMTDIDEKLSVNIDNNLFIIAGRSSTVTYSEFFEKEFYANIKLSIQKKQHNKQSCIDEILMLQFLQRVIDIKEYIDIFNDYLQSNELNEDEAKEELELFSHYIDTYEERGEDDAEQGYNYSPRLDIPLMEKAIKSILKASYKLEDDKEYLTVDNAQVPLSQTSSGQQEALRILQDIQEVIEKRKEPASRIIEEPEAHLYPTAQKEIVNLLALMLNANDKNTLIITTHSPYILACVNILLMANDVSKETKVGDKIVSDIIAKEFWLDSKMFNAYSLGNTEVYCKNIKDEETGMIDQNYLDLISVQLGLQYEQLFNLLLHNA